jgi:single-strand DNA-binding protein
MSVEINSVVIGGNLARDVVLREIGGGRKVALLVVATNRTFIVNNQKNKEVAFIDVDVWGPMGENCAKYLKKGSPVVVTGRLKQDLWQTETGEKRSKIKVVAANVQFLASANRTTAPVQEEAAVAEPAPDPAPDPAQWSE